MMTSRRNTPRKVKGSSPKNRVKKSLARWSDGLFYIIKILKVSEMTKRCLVEFEDMSTAYVHFKDLLEENRDEAKMCHNCGGQEEFDNNTFLQCTNCEREYHHHCHVPPITTQAMTKDFTCRICIFASCAKVGGARVSDPLASQFLFMKQEFPYDLEHLSWNPSHTHNVSECYCYCGGPGSWYNKMLQCCRCQQWFHEACVQCIDGEVLMGDRFYVFACAHCNYGEEFISRVDMEWFNVVSIAIFHLSMTQGLKYTDLDSYIVPFLKQKAISFGLPKLLQGKHSDKKAIRHEVLKIVTSLTDVFCCGSEVKKKCSLFGLRERIPPAPPSVYVPFPGEKITPLSLSNAQGRRVLFKPAKYSNPVPYLIKGANKFIPSSMKVREAKVARLKHEHNYCSFTYDSRSSTPTTDSMSEDYDTNNNSPAKLSLSEGMEGSSDEDDSMDVDDVDGSFMLNDSLAIAAQASPPPPTSTASSDKLGSQAEVDKNHWSLDAAFPQPSDFKGINHPFLTEYERQDLLAQRSHFLAELEHLAEEFGGNNFPAQFTPAAIFPILPPNAAVSPSLRDVKGFKGELAKLVNGNHGMDHDSPNYSTLPVHQQNGKSPPISSKPYQNGSSPTSKVLQNGVCSNSFRGHLNGSSPKSKKYHNGGVSEKAFLNTSANSQPTPSTRRSLRPTRAASSSPKSRPKHAIGLIHIKTEPPEEEQQEDYEEEEEDSYDRQKSRSLVRCLKNLTPTCGFRFPVLDEKALSLTATATATTTATNCNGVKEENHRQSSSPPPPCLISTQTDRKGRKRKRSPAARRSSTKSRSTNGDDNNADAENLVRRSHRNRQTVKRFETAIESQCHDLLSKDGLTQLSALRSAHYDVLSLRVRHDNTVDYLVDWCV